MIIIRVITVHDVSEMKVHRREVAEILSGIRNNVPKGYSATITSDDNFEVYEVVIMKENK